MKFAQLLGALFFILLLSPSEALAQSSSGVSLNPATIQQNREVEPGEVFEEVVEVTNTSDTEKTYYVNARNIVGVRDGNTPIYADREQEVTGFELSSWLRLPTEAYVLAPGEVVNIPFTIEVPSNATPGDHFAGVFVSAQPPKLRETGAGVGFDVASIVIVKIAGDRIVNAQIREFSTEDIVHSETDVDFNIRIQNTGTDIVTPTGPIEVFNMFGTRVHGITFNESLGGVFPGTVRDFVVNWSDKNPGFGRYQANIALSYQGVEGSKTIDGTTSFWILPMNIIGPALIVLFVLLVVSYVMVKLYIRRAVREVSGRRRVVRKHARGARQTSALMLVSVVLLAVTVLFLIILLLLFA